MKAGVTPTTVILGGDKRKWTPLDALILHAFQIVEDERCPQHGGPLWLCHNSDARLQVRIREDECYAKQEIDKYEESRKDKDRGGAARPEFYSVDGTPLIEFRELYYKQLAEEAAEAAEDAD